MYVKFEYEDKFLVCQMTLLTDTVSVGFIPIENKGTEKTAYNGGPHACAMYHYNSHRSLQEIWSFQPNLLLRDGEN